jgi:hypothetical protein
MQTKLELVKATLCTRGVNLAVAILASVPLIAALALSASDRALAACGGSSHPAGVHAAAGGGGGVHVTAGIGASSGGGGGGGNLGCANGSSASALHGLPIASSGRVVETGARAARTETHARTATTRTANAGARMHAIRPPHHG